MAKLYKTMFISALILLNNYIHPKTLHAQTDTLRLAFAGDIMGHTPQIKSAEVAPGRYDYDPCFQYVRPYLEAADLAIGNLELTLPGKGPYTGYPMFRSPDALADALKTAGFDVLMTANNHSNDARGPGVTKTIETLKAKGFIQSGTFKSQRERDTFYPLMVYKNNFKIAFLNYTYGTNGVPTEAPTIVNMLDTVQMAKDFAEARARKPHCIIAFVHWGLEYQLTENAEQRRLARFMIREGADLIVGMHPHVVQPIKTERVTMPDGAVKEVVVAYSLGNFISNQQQLNTDIGLIFEVDLLHHKGIPQTEVGAYGYRPIWRYIHKKANGKTTYYALPISAIESGRVSVPDMPLSAQNTMLRAAAGVRKRLGAELERQ
jgi:poly-gamma-glutamate capsule biosynthesis protein CapA/YwtB (metallophosphatase superfamily)